MHICVLKHKNWDRNSFYSTDKRRNQAVNTRFNMFELFFFNKIKLEVLIRKCTEQNELNQLIAAEFDWSPALNSLSVKSCCFKLQAVVMDAVTW